MTTKREANSEIMHLIPRPLLSDVKENGKIAKVRGEAGERRKGRERKEVRKGQVY